MIVLIEGTPGSGKSYEATVYHALRAVKRGRKVITNLPLNPDAFAEIDPEFVELIEIRNDPDPDTPIFSRVEHYHSSWRGSDPTTGKEMSPLYIIDECHRSLGTDMADGAVADWFAMHRHGGYDVVLMTQNHSDVSRKITNRVDHLIQVENLKRKGFNKLYMRRVFSDCGFRPRLEGQMTRTYKSQYFRLYNSYTQGGSGLELGSSDIRKWYLEPQVILVALIFVVASSVAIYGAGKMISTGRTPFSGKVVDQAPARAAPVAAADGGAQPARRVSATAAATVEARTIIRELGDLASLRYAGALSSDDGNLFLFNLSSGRSLVLSSTQLKAAGYTVISIGSCHITLRDDRSAQVISC